MCILEFENARTPVGSHPLHNDEFCYGHPLYFVEVYTYKGETLKRGRGGRVVQL
jgi:hypothetical protein